MKFTLDWLKDHLGTDATADVIADTLTRIGLEVEGVERRGEALKDFRVARIVDAQKHPNADKLQVCTVDAGEGVLRTVVCGAPNARAGLLSVFAPPGTYIPGSDFTLSKGNIRGVESDGMLCSARELEISDDHAGIIELPENALVGARYVDVAGLDAVVFDIAITPNRGDCTGVLGIARDLAAAGLGRLETGAVPRVPSSAGASPIAVDLRFAADEPQACRMFAGRLISGVDNRPAPDWLQKRLRAVGLRPISALVDITNFIALDRARPLHVFDADRLAGTVHARMARRGETLLALDGRTYALDETIPVIADDSGVLSIAGIIGGEASSSTASTRNVFIECAWFDPAVIAAAGRKLGIVSDARYRFERTVDPESVIPGLELATAMVLAFCGGAAFEPVVAGHVEGAATVIDFPFAEVRRLTGLRVSPDETSAVLERLGFRVVADGERAAVSVPSWRPDVTGKADLAEEVMRMVGVDKVPVEPLPRLFSTTGPMLTPIQNRRRIARRALAARGLQEAVTWSFISEAEATRFGGGTEALKLANPIAADMTDMRPSLLPGLLAALRRNANRGAGGQALFEVGQVFVSDAPQGQRSFASGVRLGGGGDGGRSWRGNTSVDVFDAKADVTALLDALGFGIDKVQLVAEPAPWSHPGRGGRLQLGPGKILGWFGELHPAWATGLDLAGTVAAFELDLDALPAPRRRATRSRPALQLSDLMPLHRDFAFVVDTAVPAAAIIKAARSAEKSLVSDVGVFDLYQGAHLPEGKKSIAIAVTLQPREKTLTDDDIEGVARSIVAAVEKATGGVLRA